MSDEEIKVVVCCQVREDTILSATPGSIQGVCKDCGHRVWLSQSGQAFLASEPTTTTLLACLECTVAQKHVVSGVVPGAIEEATAYLREIN